MFINLLSSILFVIFFLSWERKTEDFIGKSEGVVMFSYIMYEEEMYIGQPINKLFIKLIFVMII